jgi:hypothetical protein
MSLNLGQRKMVYEFFTQTMNDDTGHDHTSYIFGWLDALSLFAKTDPVAEAFMDLAFDELRPANPEQLTDAERDGFKEAGAQVLAKIRSRQVPEP